MGEVVGELGDPPFYVALLLFGGMVFCIFF
jgi:hypothetical protein